MLSGKFQNWIRRLRRDLVLSGQTAEHGATTELAKRLGVDRGDLTKWIKKDGTANPTLDRFEQCIERARPDTDLRHVVDEILAEKDIVSPPSNLAHLEEQYQATWQKLFQGNRKRAERVLKNLEHQETLGYTDLVSSLVRSIIANGPEGATNEVLRLLQAHRETPEAAEFRRRRRARMQREYEQIG